MRRINAKILTLLAVISIIITCMDPLAAKAVTLSKIEGVNYSRIYMDIREYDVTATVGGYLFPGKITRTANFDEMELNKYISIFMENNHVTSKKLSDAEFIVQDAIRETGYQSRQLLGDMVQTAAGILGGDLAEVGVAGLRGYLENAIELCDAVQKSDIKSLFTGENVEKFFTNQYKYMNQKWKEYEIKSNDPKGFHYAKNSRFILLPENCVPEGYKGDDIIDILIDYKNNIHFILQEKQKIDIYRGEI